MSARMRGWWESGLRKAAQLDPRLQRQPAVHLHRRPALKKRAASKRGTPAIAAGDSAVRLVGNEEFRCPYCLEIVEKHDARGVRVCPVCHTHHHADCWAVTGACQVPHYHE
jgi:hypothetical protein